MRISDWSSDVCSSDLIAAIAFGQFVQPVAEDDEGRRPRLCLGDIAQLDAPAAGRGRRVLVDGLFKPAVESGCADPAAPLLARLERDLHPRVQPLADRKSTRLTSSH